MDHGAFMCEDGECVACSHLVETEVFRTNDGNLHRIVGRLCCKTPFVVYLIRDSHDPNFAYIGMAVDGVLDRFRTGHKRQILRIMRGEKYDYLDKDGKKRGFLKVQRYFAAVSLAGEHTGVVSDRFIMTPILRCEDLEDLRMGEIHMMNVVLDVHNSRTLNQSIPKCSADCRFCAAGKLSRPLVS